MFRPGTTDGFNRYSNRNIHNTDKRDYNCAGYALDIFSWYCPYEDIYNNPFGNLELFNKFSPSRTSVLLSCVNQLLSDFSDLRVIYSIAELNDNEYAIAFRLSWDDFHFVRRAEDGRWYQKRGAENRIRTMTEKELFSDKWGGRYDGNIVFFAKRK